MFACEVALAISPLPVRRIFTHRKTAHNTALYTLLFISVTLCFVGKAWAEWRLLPPLADVYETFAGTTNLAGMFTFPEINRTNVTYEWALYDLNTGQRVHTCPYVVDDSLYGSDTDWQIAYADTNNNIHLQYTYYFRTYNATGTLLQDWQRRAHFPQPQSASHTPKFARDDSANTYFVNETTGMGLMIGKYNPALMLIRSTTFVTGHQYYTKLITLDGQGGCFLYVKDNSSQRTESLYHVFADSTVQGSVFFRSNAPTNQGVFDLAYASNTRQLLLFQGGPGAVIYCFTLDPDSMHFTNSHTMFSSEFGIGVVPGIASTPDTTWFVRDVAVWDSATQRVVYGGFALWAHTTGTEWFPVDSFPPDVLPFRGSNSDPILYLYTQPRLTIHYSNHLLSRFPDTTSVYERPIPTGSNLIALSPNPFNSMSVVSGLLGFGGSFYVYDVMGRKIIEHNLHPGTKRFSLSLPPSTSSGSYFLYVIQPNHPPQVRRFQLVH